MMRIVSVELRNIKSYDASGCAVEFRPGVNLIWGENGSGKTTLLEAIGFALFDSLELNLKQFRRKGENEGEIVLILEGADERYYKITRKIGISANLEIRDFEDNRKISKTKEDAEKWISQTVGVEFGGFGKILFENVLGVSQGRMVESFMQTPTVRKGIFEPILKLEGYDLTWSYLGLAQVELADRIANAKNKAANLVGQLSNLPGVQAELMKLLDQVALDENDLADLRDCLKRQEYEFSLMEAIWKSLDALEKQISQFTDKIENAARGLQYAERLRNESAAAAQVLETCQEGHRAYLQAQATLTDLEIRQQEREVLNKALRNIDDKLTEVSAQIRQIETQLAAVTRAEQQIVDLEPFVQQQKNLEKQIQLKQKQVELRQQALESREKLQVKLHELEKRLIEIQQGLVRRSQVETTRDEHQNALSTLLPIIENIDTRLSALQIELDQASQALHHLDLQVQSLEYLRNQLAEKEADLQKDQQSLEKIENQLVERGKLLESVERQNQALEAEQSRLTTAQNDQKNATQLIDPLEERRALLQQVETAECPVCKKPLAEHEAAQIEAEFSEEIAALKQKIASAKSKEKEADKAIRQIKKSLKETSEQLDRLSTLDQKLRAEQGILDKRAAIVDIQRQIDERIDIPVQAAKQDAEIQALRLKIAELNAQRKQCSSEREEFVRDIAKLNQQLMNLPQPSQAQHFTEEIADQRDQISSFEQQAHLLVNAPAELKEMQETQSKLGNPINEQAQQRGIANQRSMLERKRGELQEEKLGQESQRSALLTDLQVYADLDQKLKDSKALRDLHQNHYERYITNQQVAEALTQREIDLAKLTKEHHLLGEQLIQATQERDTVKATFDEVQYRALSETISSNHRKKAAIESRILLEKDQAEKKQVQLTTLLNIQGEFESANKEVTRLGKLAQVLYFVREGIRKAAPQIARKRVQIVSYSANRIFRQILLSTHSDGGPAASSDPGTLNWDNTYEVIVRRSGEDLVFKQLSGGEKMTAAIAIRMALLSQMTSNLRLLFLDEPTANMDDARRNQLAEQITRLEGLNQLFVITHDDAFERSAHHVLQVFKNNDVSRVEIKS